MIVTTAIAANTVRCTASAVQGPQSSAREIFGRLGSAAHQWRWAAPMVEPAMKAASVISMRVEPPPTV
jgi:hypothetical protein